MPFPQLRSREARHCVIAIITSMVATYGAEAVAGFGIASRTNLWL
ncbi:hypothetical protein [Stanieria cyanosphaera]|nr:hypothetical protein [Stanieria cyanosphaera]